jgi:hypothetical protein
MNFYPSCREMPIAESPWRSTLWANPTIQLLNSQPKFSLSDLGDREAVQRTKRVKPLTISSPARLELHHKQVL